MLTRDLMTTAVVTVPPDTPISAIAQLMADRGISGVPVVDADAKLLGLVTDGDLMRCLAAETNQPGSSFYALFQSKQAAASHYSRSHGRRASDVMTTDLVTVSEDTPVEAVARLLETRRIRRVPVVRDSILVGLVSRADLVRIIMMPPIALTGVPDNKIRADLTSLLRQQRWADTYYLFPEVAKGVVTFHGFAGSPEFVTALRALAEKVPGVTGVVFDTQPTPWLLFGVP